MGQSFSAGGLTNTGVRNPSGGMEWFNADQARQGLLAKALTPGPGQVQPASSNTDASGNVQFNQPTPNMPQSFKPSFLQAAGMGAGPGQENATSPGLSKMGKLAVLLSSGVQGALAGRAADEQTIAATGGRRGGGAGTGFQAGFTLPWQRAQQQQQVQRGAIENQMMQANLQPVQTPYGTLPWFRAQQVAGLNKDIAETRSKGFLTPRGGGVYDVNQQAYAPGAGPTPQRENTPEQHVLDYLTTAKDPTLGRPLNADEAYQRIEQIKAGSKQETGSDFERYYGGLVKQGTADTPENRMSAYGQWVKNEPQYIAAQQSRQQQQNTSQDARLDRSYQFNSTQLEKIRAPIDQRAERLTRVTDAINQHDPQADSLIAPELLSVMAGGQASGLRMNEAEISRIVGGRSNWEDIKAALNKWKPNDQALSITDSQRAMMQKLVGVVASRVQQKQQILSDGEQRLVGATNVNQHRQIVTDTRNKLAAVDAGGGQIQVTDPMGGVHTFPDQGSANRFKQAAGIR